MMDAIDTTDTTDTVHAEHHGVFRPFEAQALRWLAIPVLGETLTETVLCEAEMASFEHTGVGYFLTVRHPLLPAPRYVLHQPMVIGRVDDVEGSYLAFIEDHTLMLEFAGIGEVPADIRHRDVLIELARHAAQSV